MSESPKKSKINYKNSGVDVHAGDSLVEWLQKTESQKSSQILSGIGGFASIFKMNSGQYKNPCLVTCTDGVGTKVKLAAQYGQYQGIGQDLVAMCVNDLICTGADPLLFLDYYATSRLDLTAAQEFLKSVRRACAEAECLLVGGETAEMPGVYHQNDFDCAGFAVGIVEEDQIVGPHRVRVNDCLVGVSSSGCHSNGYSLLRKLFEKDMDQYKEDLLVPTALYVRLWKEVKKQKIDIHAMAHITGGGIQNIPRVIPANMKAMLRAWPMPNLFKEVQKRAHLADDEMRDTLNCGVGFVFVLSEEESEKLKHIIRGQGFHAFDLGSVLEYEGESIVEVQ